MSLPKDVFLAIECCLLTYWAVKCAHVSRVLKQNTTQKAGSELLKSHVHQLNNSSAFHLTKRALSAFKDNI